MKRRDELKKVNAKGFKATKLFCGAVRSSLVE
jgi:hypothetical protein